MNLAPPTVSDLFDPELRATGQLPVEVHCHGFGPVDFSDLSALDLDRLEAACVAEGLMAITAGDNVLRLAPPLVVTDSDLDEAVVMLRRATRRVLPSASKEAAQ